MKFVLSRGWKKIALLAVGMLSCCMPETASGFHREASTPGLGFRV